MGVAPESEIPIGLRRRNSSGEESSDPVDECGAHVLIRGRGIEAQLLGAAVSRLSFDNVRQQRFAQTLHSRDDLSEIVVSNAQYRGLFHCSDRRSADAREQTQFAKDATDA